MTFFSFQRRNKFVFCPIKMIFTCWDNRECTVGSGTNAYASFFSNLKKLFKQECYKRVQISPVCHFIDVHFLFPIYLSVALP